MPRGASMRRANPDDARLIRAVMLAVWPHEKADLYQIAAAIRAPDHITHLAERDGAVVGFVDSFQTPAGNTLRWEIDLLAVVPHSRGLKIGQRLVQISCGAGKKTGAAICRGLIAVSNTAGQAAFQRCGFQKEAQVNWLYTASDAAGIEIMPAEETSLLAVTTMNYRGKWLEAPYTHRRLKAAKTALADENVDLVGAVIPANLQESCLAADALGYRRVGAYQWWCYPAR